MYAWYLGFVVSFKAFSLVELTSWLLEKGSTVQDYQRKWGCCFLEDKSGCETVNVTGPGGSFSCIPEEKQKLWGICLRFNARVYEAGTGNCCNKLILRLIVLCYLIVIRKCKEDDDQRGLNKRICDLCHP